MAFTLRRKKTNLFNRKQYWYHVSTTLKNDEEHLIPWGTRKGFNRSLNEPDGNRICVAPTIEQCITAIPYILTAKITIYRTKSKVIAYKSNKIFDMNVTNEGWLLEPTTFIKIGTLDFEDVEKGLAIEMVIPESATGGVASYSGKVLRWWKKARIKRFIKTS